MAIIDRNNRASIEAAQRKNAEKDAEQASRRAAGEVLTSDGWIKADELAQRQATLSDQIDDLISQLGLEGK